LYIFYTVFLFISCISVDADIVSSFCCCFPAAAAFAAFAGGAAAGCDYYDCPVKHGGWLLWSYVDGVAGFGVLS